MTTIKNNHKVKGAFVWHGNEICEISKCDADINNDLILDRRIRVKRNQVKLVRIGDEVSFKKSLVNTLPDRITFGKRKITHIRENGMIGTDKDSHEHDDSAYKHFEKWVGKTLKKGDTDMTLQQCKDQVAVSYGYENWVSMDFEALSKLLSQVDAPLTAGDIKNGKQDNSERLI